MESITNLFHMTFEQSYKWTVNNLKCVPENKGFFIISPKVYFSEPNATWYIKFEKMVCGDGTVCIEPIFYVCDDGKDENARYKFEFKIGDKVSRSALISRSTKKSKDSFFMHKMEAWSMILPDCDTVELEAKVIFETLEHRHPREEETESEYDTLVDSPRFNETLDTETEENLPENVKIPIIIPIKKPSLLEKLALQTTEHHGKRLSKTLSSSSTFSELSNDFDDSDSDDSSVSIMGSDRLRPGYRMSNNELVEQIRNIYLQKMKQIADTSSRLLVTAARNNFADMLSESSQSFAAQLSSTNFPIVWKIATELEATELKQATINYVVRNRERLTYDSRISSDLMLEVVRAIN